VAVVVACLGVLAAAPSEAGPLDIFGLSARSTALGGGMSGEANDFSALYYNMAAMSFTEPNIGMGILVAVDDVNIGLKARPPGYDLPDRGQTSARIPTSYLLRPRENTDDILNTYGFYIGAVSSLGIPNLRIGGMAYLPVNRLGLQRTHFVDEREQYFSNGLDFELLGVRTQHQVIIVGASYAVTEWFSVGLGLSFLPSTGGTNFVYIDNPTDQANVDVVLNQEQAGNVAPHAGVMIEAAPGVQVGLTWRGEIYLSVDVKNEIQIRGFQTNEDVFPVLQNLPNTLAYSPHQLVMGASYKAEGLSVMGDVTYSLWDRYLNNQAERNANFRNTLTPRIGVEMELEPWFTVRTGIGYERTPVPEQTGRTNYVDNDRLILSMGTGHPLELFGFPVEVSWFVQAQYLVPRDVNKLPSGQYANCEPGVSTLCDELPDEVVDPSTGQPVPQHQGLQTGNPGFPGFGSWGQLLALGIDVRWRY